MGDILNHSAHVSGITSGINNGINSGLNDVRMQIIALMQENPAITTQMIADALRLDVKNAEAHIRYLKKKDILERKGAKRNGKWVVKHLKLK
jgi:predicted HTH transcriptional regulator